MKPTSKIAAVLAVCMLSSMLYIPVSAAKYTDIIDPDTALAVSVLDALDVVEGFPDGGYHPGEVLTRAQFCKLAVLLLDLEDKLISAGQKALFYDVTYSHWAVSHINLAYENGFIQGYGNGIFGPDDPVTYAQVLTMLLRILGYTDAEIGSVYPDDAMHMANKLELTDGIDLLPEDAVTRGDAARLLLNLMDTENKAGARLYSLLAKKTVEDVVLLDEDSVSSSGKANCAKLYVNGQTVWYEKAADIPAFAVGCEGAALLDESGDILAVIPHGTRYTTVNGVLVSQNDRIEESESELTYEVVIYSNGMRLTYPRSGSISANLVGMDGTLLIDENGYASAFVSADADVYTLVKNAILLDEDDTSSSGDKGCAKLYVNGQTVWYERSGFLPSSLVGCEGTVLTDGDGKLFAFVSDGDSYTAVDGILVSNNRRAHGDSELPYEVVIYSEGENLAYPRANTVSQSLVGAEGTLLLNENGYATAFISADTDFYTVIEDVVLLDNKNDDGCAEFYINGTTDEYELARGADISSKDIGNMGVLLLNDDKEAAAFIPEEDEYYVEYGVLLDFDSREAVFLIDGDEEEYDLDCKLSQTLIGSGGSILINEDDEVVAFMPDGDGGAVIEDAILIDNDCTADDGTRHAALFLINGKTVWYEQEDRLSRSHVGCSGRLILDEDGLVIGFEPDGEEYDIEYGVLLDMNRTKAVFYLDGETDELRLDCTIPSNYTGLYGIILLDQRGRVAHFVPDSTEEGYTMSDEGILLTVNETAPDGRTVRAHMFTDGNIITYKINGSLDDSSEGLCGRFILDEDGRAVGFAETDTNASLCEVITATESSLICESAEYRMKSSIPVIADGELTSWSEVWNTFEAGDEIAVYFNYIGNIYVLVTK